MKLYRIITMIIYTLCLISFICLDYLKSKEIQEFDRLNRNFNRLIEKRLIHPIEIESRLSTIERYLREQNKKEEE